MNLKSTNLEAHFFNVFDSVLDQDVPIAEIVTDANNQIISIMSRFISRVCACAYMCVAIDVYM